MITKKLVENELHDFFEELLGITNEYMCDLFPKQIKGNKFKCNGDCAQCVIDYLKTLFN